MKNTPLFLLVALLFGSVPGLAAESRATGPSDPFAGARRSSAAMTISRRCSDGASAMLSETVSGFSAANRGVSSAATPDDGSAGTLGPSLEHPSPDSARTSGPLPEPPARVLILLAQLADGFRAMPAYSVRFEIVADDSAVRGGYSVQGGSYYLQLGDAEVYTDGATRYEVDNRRREVTIVEVDTASRNILDNPVRAFEFLDSTYRPTLLDERDGEADILLSPTGDAGAVAGAVTLTVTTSPVRPRLLAYDFDGERITVAITGISPLQTPLRRFDRASYANYEWIDFR